MDHFPAGHEKDGVSKTMILISLHEETQNHKTSDAT